MHERLRRLCGAWRRAGRSGEFVDPGGRVDDNDVDDDDGDYDDDDGDDDEDDPFFYYRSALVDFARPFIIITVIIVIIIIIIIFIIIIIIIVYGPPRTLAWHSRPGSPGLAAPAWQAYDDGMMML